MSPELIDALSPQELREQVSKEMHVLRDWVDDVRTPAVLRADIDRRQRESDMIGCDIKQRFLQYLMDSSTPTVDAIWCAVNASPRQTARAYLKAIHCGAFAKLVFREALPTGTNG